MKSVTSIINECHLNNNSTIGQNDIGVNLSDPLTPNINLSTAYAFKSIEELALYHDSKIDNLRYTRDSSNLTQQLEYYFEKIYMGEKAFLFNTGMAAVITAIDCAIDGVEKIITIGVNYRKTEIYLEEKIKEKGLKGKKYKNYKEIEGENKVEIRDNKILIYVENFSNPYLNFIEIKEIRKTFPKAKIIVDATMLGLMNGNDDLNYADIICASCTKYIGGHNDVLGGCVVINNREFINRVWSYRSMHGNILSPFSTYLLLRSLRTYDLRMKQIIVNTSKILSFLEISTVTKKIYYPGRYENKNEDLPECVTHGGGVVSFMIDEKINLKKNIKSLSSIKMAPSFGSVDTLIEIPIYMSQVARKRYTGMNQDLYKEKFIRLSVGCEPINYLLNDLNKIIAE